MLNVSSSLARVRERPEKWRMWWKAWCCSSQKTCCRPMWSVGQRNDVVWNGYEKNVFIRWDSGMQEREITLSMASNWICQRWMRRPLEEVGIYCMDCGFFVVSWCCWNRDRKESSNLQLRRRCLWGFYRLWNCMRFMSQDNWRKLIIYFNCLQQ